MTDQALANRIREKDEEAFEKLYDKYHDLVYYVIIKIVHNSEASKELLQDVFLKVYMKIDQYSGGNFKYWILQIAKHEAINYVNRVQSKENNIILDEKIVEEAKDTGFSLGKFDDLLRENFDSESKDIIILKIVFDYSFNEISEEMGLNKSHVFRKFKSSISKLKYLVKENNYE